MSFVTVKHKKTSQTSDFYRSYFVIKLLIFLLLKYVLIIQCKLMFLQNIFCELHFQPNPQSVIYDIARILVPLMWL